MDKKNPRDSFLPFREKAPSHTTILEEPSPYQPENVRQCVGFFEAVMFHAIIFKCKILLEEKHQLFQSIGEWLLLVDCYVKEGKDNSFFCDRCAYSPTNIPGQKYAPECWPPATKWEKYLLDHPDLSFLQLFKYLDSLNMESVGSLTSYLRATDFAYVGIVPFPSPTEVAKAIITLGAGARNGLAKLKVWAKKKKKGNTDDKIARFVFLHDKVKSLLSPGKQADIGYDMLMLEHSLCKLSKMTRFKDIKHSVLNGL